MSLRLASPFQDHAVLQRDQTLPVWGWAAPNARIRVTLAGNEAHGLSNAQGDWLVRLPALSAGGPHSLTVEAAGETLVITDLLVGEVWLASGQSNMEWPLDQSRPFTDEAIATADFPGIRFFKVGRCTHLGPQRIVEGAWESATPATAPKFSAVAFSFARRLHRELGVPVGILSSSWGGTIIEAWTSRSTLAHNPEIAAWFTGYEARAWTADRWKNVGPMGADGRASNASSTQLPADPGITQPWHAADLDDSAWSSINLPANWQSTGEKYSGVFWFRRTVEIPAAWVGRDLRFHLGAADKQDIAYVNGAEVGRTGKDREDRFWNVPRTYTVPAALVTGRRLVIAVRVYSFIYDGGLIGPAAEMRVQCADASLPLAGAWRLRCEHNLGLVVPPAPVMGHGEPNSPHMLFDNMIAPLVPYALRGAIWYQGESNESAPHLYARLLRDLVEDWRRQWGLPSLSFHTVQLTAFRPPQAHQPDSLWARIREAQTALLSLSGTGLAVITDLGEAADIHPKNKVPVGERLAQSALARDYHRALVPNGPLASAFSFNGATARVAFTYSDGVLSTTDGGAPRTFFVAGTDKVFHPATARIEGTSVMATSPAVPAPVAVRYAWADNPEGSNLTGASGLPASPFRSDRW